MQLSDKIENKLSIVCNISGNDGVLVSNLNDEIRPTLLIITWFVHNGFCADSSRAGKENKCPKNHYSAENRRCFGRRGMGGGTSCYKFHSE